MLFAEIFSEVANHDPMTQLATVVLLYVPFTLIVILIIRLTAKKFFLRHKTKILLIGLLLIVLATKFVVRDW